MYLKIKDIILIIRDAFKKKGNVAILVLEIFIWGLILSAVLAVAPFASNKISYEAFWELLAAIIVAALISSFSIFNWFAKRKIQTTFIGFTAKYLLELDRDRLDDLLGFLAQERISKLKVDPIVEFFKAIKELYLKSDYEMRRRITEALPALFKINFEESMRLVDILRYDFDDKWKSDLRRRTIESFKYLTPRQLYFIKEFLQVFEKDEIYTIIAIVEVLDYWRSKRKKNEALKLFNQLLIQLSKSNFGRNEIDCIKIFWNILELISIDLDKAIKKFEKLKDDKNFYLQICLARNLKCLSKRYPEKMLGLMSYFLGDDKYVNVRRPIAKEDSIDCIINLCDHRNYEKKIKRVLWKLIHDKDDIIRITTFDRIEKILDKNKKLGKNIINEVKNDTNNKLSKRAKRLLEQL